MGIEYEKELYSRMENLRSQLEGCYEEITHLTNHAKAAEEELARLRAPAGEVGGLVRRLQAFAHEIEHICGGPRGWWEGFNAAAELLTRQAAQIERLAKALDEEREALRANNEETAEYEAELREAGDVMRHVSIACDTYGEDLSFGDMKTVHRIQKLVRAFLTKLEKIDVSPST